DKFTLITYPPNSIIHQKDTQLNSLGIVLKGTIKVISEFENGSVFMIERNDAICFIGEVTLLSGREKSSVAIECVAECVVAYISKNDFNYWIDNDNNFLKTLAKDISQKLYLASYDKGEYIFYPSKYTLLKFIKRTANELDIENSDAVKISKTRQEISEEIGITLKTLNRCISCLRDENVISIEKGKIKVTKEQYEKFEFYKDKYMRQYKNGFNI
ncbi:MAG: Crp/Fnr family transcriptional regulator, partial [Oscillospiraceae bacterium]